MAEDVAVKVDNLTFTYERGPLALQDVTFDVRKGEILGILGSNGAGKTTLCFHLNGIIPTVYAGTEKGKVEMCGLDPWETPILEMSQKASMVLQDPETQFTTTDVSSELAFGPANLAIEREEIFRRSEWAAKVCGIDGLEERKPKELSGGQKQRVALAAGLTMLPQVLILDEPTSQLDPVGTTEVFDVVHHLADTEDMTIIITSHKTDEVARLAHKILLLDEGKVIAYGGPKEVFAQTELLDSVGVNPPSVASLAAKISAKAPRFKDLVDKSGGIPLTIDEAESLFKKALDDGIVKIDWKNPPLPPRRSEEVVLEMDNVTFTYPARIPVTALKNIDLKVHRGEYIAIIGQNGSGKTTLVKHFLGLLEASEGVVRIEGEDASELTIGSIAKSISLILQNPDYQLFSISVEKELAFGPRNLGLSEEEIEQRVEWAMKEVGLEDVRDIFPFRLSFGDRRKVAAAAGIAMDPEILILDEPTTAQDFVGRHVLCQIASRMRDQGKTIIMISHDMDLVATYADRLVIMSDARIIADGPKREVFGMDDVMKQAFLKPPQITQLGQRLTDYGIRENLVTVDEMADVFKAGGV
ncbi:MAG: ATP-binding cassette domain-containing protein [Candidatus Thorarchaeota archaeon]|nr:MAG: ATP-binding cassette domain-containing protein [Candidatus Thorarchaeota archaeon]